jgi:hypothetical protein
LTQKNKYRPVRIYRCPEPGCGYETEHRFVLKNHLINVHGYRKKEAALEASQNEYYLMPRYIRASYYEDNPFYDDEDDE